MSTAKRRKSNGRFGSKFVYIDRYFAKYGGQSHCSLLSLSDLESSSHPMSANGASAPLIRGAAFGNLGSEPPIAAI